MIVMDGKKEGRKEEKKEGRMDGWKGDYVYPRMLHSII